MRKILTVTLVLVPFVLLFSSCATTHPNEQLIMGKWNTVSVEKILPEKQQAAEPQTGPGGTAITNDTGAKTGKGGGKSGSSGEAGARAEEQFNRLYRAEQKATLEIFPNKTAVKDYHGTLVKATWKMKPSGKKIVAKSIKTKERIVLEIEELTDTKAVVIEKLPVGALKITYAKEKQ